MGEASDDPDDSFEGATFGRVVKVAPTTVTLESFDNTYEFGPPILTPSSLAVGQRVVCMFVDGDPENLIILGTVNL